MPPATRGGALPAPPVHGNVLDRALHVARTQAPQTPAGKGFFNALKPQSSLFPETTRVNVADLPAQARQQARVVPAYTPPETPTKPIGRGVAFPKPTHSKSLLGGLESAAKGVASYVEHNPVRTAAQVALPGPLSVLANPLVGKAAAAANTETNKELAKLAAPSEPSAGVQAAASTNAGILNSAKGIPYANLTTAGQAAVKKAALFFAGRPSYHYQVPDLGIFGAKDKAAYKLPPTATDGDYIRALGAEISGAGHRSYIEQLVHNIPLNTLQMAAAPVGAAYLLTHPISGGKEFAREQYQFGKSLIPGIGDPLKTLRDQPISVITTALGVGRAAGGFAGTVSRTGALGEAAKAFSTPTPRSVVPAGFDLKGANGEAVKAPAIPRGMTSTKLDERIAQAASDKLAAKVPFFGNRLDRQFRNDITRGSHQASRQVEQAALDPAIRAAAKLNKHEVRSVSFFHGQGYHNLSEAVAYTTKKAAEHRATEQAAIDHVGTETHADWQVAQKYLDNQQKVAEGLHRKLGDIPTAKMADALTKLTGATRAGEQQISGMSRQGTSLPLVPEETMLRRAYMPRAQIDASLYGKPEAQRVLDLAPEANSISAKLAKAPETGTTVYRQAQNLATGRPAGGRGLRSIQGDTSALKISKQQYRDELSQVQAEQMRALHEVRSQFRAERGAPPVEPNAPLDPHDPLFFQHVMEGTKGLRGVFRGQGQGMMNENVATRFQGGRLGHAGQQSTAQLFADARASTDPHIYFGGVAKPFKVAAALRHFRAQVEQSIIAPKAGTVYDTSKYVRIRADGGGMPNTDVPTSVDATQAIHELSDQGLRDQIMSGIKQEKKRIQSQIPDDGHEYYLMTRHAADNLENTFKSYDSKTLRAIKHTTGLWRWATLMARPAWLVNNVAGNTIQATTGGAGLLDYSRALRTGPGQKYEGIVQPASENTGFYRNTFSKPTGIQSTLMKPIHILTNHVVEWNVRYENFTRRALDLHRAAIEAKAALHNEPVTLTSSFHRITPETIEYMKKPTPEAAARIVKHVTTWEGNFTKLHPTPIWDVVSPFHSWFTFIGKLVAEMPLKTPGRSLLLQRLGAYGINIQNQQFGGFVPNSMQGSLQLAKGIPLVGGLWKSTQGINPYATAFQLLSPNDQSSTNPGQINPQGLLGALNPGFGALWNFAKGQDFQTGATLKDQYGNPVGNYNVGVLGHGVLGSVPFYSLLGGYAGADNTVSPFGAQRLPKATDQPQQSLFQRAVGYGLGSVKPYDVTLNRDKSIKRLKAAVVTEAKNKLANG